ncbi:MAG: AAA family ATPase [Candidatus Poribacteria bacterium]|nr:AAA family ATPase [Candidatus Poribacteria bacterium]
MPQREVHLRDYLEILWKHDFVICLSFLLILGTALIVSVRLPKSYAASTLILFIQPPSSPPVSSTSLFQSVLSGGVDRSEMETVGQRFSSTSMLASAIEKLEDADIRGARHLPSIPSLKQNLKARIRSDTRYIELSLRLREDEGGERNAALLMNQLIREMQALRSRAERAKADHRREFLDQKLTELLQQVKKQEEAALQFVRKSGSPATLYPRLSSLLEHHTRLRDAQMQIERELGGAQLELKHLRKEIENYPAYVKLSETTSHDPIWLFQMEKVADLESQRIGLAQQVGENSPEIKALDAQIADIRSNLKSFVAAKGVTSSTQGPSSLHWRIQDQFINLQLMILRSENSLTQIQLQLDGVTRELQHLVTEIPENEMYFEKLRREIDFIHELKKEIYKQSLEAEILIAESDYWRSESGHRRISGGIEVVDPPVPQKIPVSPRIKFVAIVAGIIGCIIGISVALLIEYFGNTYRLAADIQSELDLLHLGTIATLKEREQSFPALSEDYRTVAANIDLSQPEIRKQILMLASCDGDEDVSAVTANLGTTLASVKEAVLIVDCNLSQPVQHQIFDLSSDADRTGVFEADQMDWEDVIQHTDIPDLDLLSASSLSSHPIDFLRLPRLQTFFQQLRQRYELILIDAPPILPTADSLILSVHCDAVVLVVGLDRTTREMLRMSRARLENTQTPVLGFIET